MQRTIIDVHILQTLPPSNVNRDDTGSPKSAMYGGVRRARVSSQAWKRATRKAFDDVLDASDLGVRTRRVVETVAEAVRRQAPDLADQAEIIAEDVLKTTGIKLAKPKARKGTTGDPDVSGYLIFLSRRQIDALADLGVAAARNQQAVDKNRARDLFKTGNSIDLALFGRMVADVTDLNVDAAAQVAHAISVHEVTNEYDYFTAVDDRKDASRREAADRGEDADEDAGAAMIGTIEFNSSTLYRYATVDVNALLNNLGDGEATARAASAFIDAFVTSMPTGKQNTFANRTLPDAVLVAVRSDQPISLVGAFEEAVVAEDGRSQMRLGIDKLAAYNKELVDAFARAPDHAWVVGIGDRTAALEASAERVSLDQLVTHIGELVRARTGAL